MALGKITLLCECNNASCTSRFEVDLDGELTPDLIHALHATGHFFVDMGHVARGELITTEHEGFAIVRPRVRAEPVVIANERILNEHLNEVQAPID